MTEEEGGDTFGTYTRSEDKLLDVLSSPQHWYCPSGQQSWCKFNMAEMVHEAIDQTAPATNSTIWEQQFEAEKSNENKCGRRKNGRRHC